MLLPECRILKKCVHAQRKGKAGCHWNFPRERILMKPPMMFGLPWTGSVMIFHRKLNHLALWKFDPDNFPVVILGARSPRGMAELTRILEREISQQFEQIPGAGSVDVWGGVYREIQVRLKRDRLASSQLSATDVRQAVIRENVTLPAGDMREGISDMYVRTKGEYQSLEEIANTIITMVDGQPIRVNDVAEVVDGFQDINRLVQIDGLPMVRLGIRKQSGANTVDSSERST